MRICSVCGSNMREEYCICNGEDYYCTDECLHKKITEDEYIELYERNVAYWKSILFIIVLRQTQMKRMLKRNA